MNKLALSLTLLASVASLVACGGGGGGTPTPLVAASNVTANVNASTVNAVAGQSFSFASGVPSLGTTSATTVALNSASTFTVSSAQGTANGKLTFGSCIFTVTTSTYPAGSKLAAGQVIEVTPCSITAQTGGLSVSAGATAVPVTFDVGNSVSAAQNFTVDILDNGTVVVNGASVATVQTTAATGATGASGG
ncbi:hypothetical protein [Ramlibacter sp.]|uniref:hypothetical protein n=1 Tax=Ramlibacter sp. TaxID=1917967 RepID=UPI00260B9337|nr:hypothetical protein [Ramlibacter sp.]MDB5957093.1 hypothetical protein [Ramlibacter sp.]